MTKRSAIVIGAGTNGLACAFRLASQGWRVTVAEARDEPGGGAATTEFAPGYRVSGLAHLVTCLDDRVRDGMDLVRHGLAFATDAMPATALDAGGQHLTFAGGRTDGPDASAWKALHGRLLAYAQALAPFREMTPPRLAKGARNELVRLARLGWGLRRSGKDEFREFLRLLLINVADVLDDELTDRRLKGAIAFDATLGAWMGPRSPNSLILYLNRLSSGAGAAYLPRGGLGAVAAAMTAACLGAGVTIRTGTPVARVLVEDDRASGVVLDGGEELPAALVVSAAGPRTTFRHLVGPRPLDAGFHTRAGHIQARGGAAKLHLALTGAPDFRSADLRHRLLVAPSVRAVEDAWNPVKYGEVPDEPVMEIVVPSAHEPGLAPEGHHVLSAIVQFAPHAPADPEAARAAMLENTLAVLESQAPGIGRLIAHAELLMPYDIEARYGLDGGCWHQAELSVEQMLFLRPLPEAAQYATPLPGLWLAGAGNHPGGGISGAAGWNAAERILREVR